MDEDKKEDKKSDDDLSVAKVDATEVEKSIKKKDFGVPDKCSLCEAGLQEVDYKDVYRLKRFTSRRGRMIPRTRSGLCSKHQKQVAKAIKLAREMALLPYVADE